MLEFHEEVDVHDVVTLPNLVDSLLCSCCIIGPAKAIQGSKIASKLMNNDIVVVSVDSGLSGKEFVLCWAKEKVSQSLF